MVGNLDHETNFPHKLLLTNKHQKNKNYSPANIKLSKSQLSKIIQS